MKSLILALALCLPASFALASGDDLPLTAAVQTQITEHLTAQGYEVRQIKVEDGYYEAYVIRDGQRAELYLDAEMNIVTRTGDH